MRIVRNDNGTTFMIGAKKAGNKSEDVLFRVTASNWLDISSYKFEDITKNYKPHGSGFQLLHILNDQRLIVQRPKRDFGISMDEGSTFEYITPTVVGEKPLWDDGGDENPSGNSLTQDPKNESRWLLGNGWGIQSSDDGGKTWKWTQNGIGEVFCFFFFFC